MTNQKNNRNGCIHLYNPKEEGLGKYDINYINAYRKIRLKPEKSKCKTFERYAA
tara:strand:+ start:187 stop:348 length:162 start_codon:yes stop_codon:yes gene_type:complete